MRDEQKRRFVRAVASSALATALDAAAFHTLAWASGWLALPAAFGSLCGGVSNFALNRRWAFDSSAPLVRAAWRYAVVSAAAAALHAGLVTAIARLFGGSPTVAWLISRGLIFSLMTFPLFRYWVFPPRPTDTAAFAREARPAPAPNVDPVR